MTFWPLLICTGLYVVTAIGFARDGNGPLAVAFGGYRWQMWDFFGWRGGKTGPFYSVKKTFMKVIFYLAYSSTWRIVGE